MSRIATFRAALIDLVDEITDSPIDRLYDFMPAEMKDNSAFVIGDIIDKATDARDGVTHLIFARQATTYCLVKIRDNKRAEAEERADEMAELIISALDASTWSWNLQVRKSVGYGIGQYQYQGIELTLEFYQVD